jgi:hypothetical protein
LGRIGLPPALLRHRLAMAGGQAPERSRGTRINRNAGRRVSPPGVSCAQGRDQRSPSSPQNRSAQRRGYLSVRRPGDPGPTGSAPLSQRRPAPRAEPSPLHVWVMASLADDRFRILRGCASGPLRTGRDTPTSQPIMVPTSTPHTRFAQECAAYHGRALAGAKP